MFPKSPKQVKKSKFSLLNRKHVGNSNSNSQISVDASMNDNRGWLESNNLQPTPPRLSEQDNKPSQQDMLGLVSDEDILKLTQLTSILPEISSSKQHHHHHSHKSPSIGDTQQPPSPIIKTTTTPEPSEDKIPIEDDTNPLKLYKIQSNTNTTEAKDIVNQFYQKEPIKNRKRSNTQVRDTSPYVKQQQEDLRRHSFDNLRKIQEKPPWTPPEIIVEKQPDNVSTKAVMENTPLISIEEVKTYMFDYKSLPDEVQQILDVYEREGKLEITKMTVKYSKGQYSDSSSISTDEDDDDDDDEDDDEKDPNTVSYHDLIIGSNEKVNYKTNPVRDIAVLTTTTSDNVDFTKLIQLSPNEQGFLLDLHVSMFRDNKIENEVNEVEEEFSEILQNVDKKLKAINAFVQESDFSLQEQLQTLRSLNLFEDPENKRPKLPRTYSQPSFQLTPFTPEEPSSSSGSSYSSSISISSSSSSMSSSSGIILRPTRELLSENYRRHAQSMIYPSFKKTKDPFSYRQEEIERLVKSLKSELAELTTSLENTEDLVSDVQVDMDDFRNRMETYIKDIPESHYSALRKLEVDIESILSKRAKNPWLETGYALLSYLLTLFALFFWIIIYVLKMFEKVFKLPYKLWKEGSDYFMERNKRVRRASLDSVKPTWKKLQ